MLAFNISNVKLFYLILFHIFFLVLFLRFICVRVILCIKISGVLLIIVEKIPIAIDLKFLPENGREGFLQNMA